MPTTAVVYPTSSSNWTNTNNANASDGSFATDVTSRVYNAVDLTYEMVPTNNLVCGSFTGIAAGVGAGDVINGISVSIQVKQAGGGGINGTLWLARAGSIVGSPQSVSLISGVVSTYNLGGVSDTFGGSWSGANIGQLQVVFYAKYSTGTGTATVSVDSISAQATYTAATPSAFTFTDVTNAALGGFYNSNIITIAGLGGPTVAVSTNSAFALYSKNGGPLTSSAGTAKDGDTFLMQIQASNVPATAVHAILTVGGTSDSFDVTTVAADTTPDAFSWVAQTGVNLSTQYTASNVVTVSGVNAACSLSISGGSGQYSKNGGAWTSAAGSVVNGDTLQVRCTSSGSYSTLVTCTVTISATPGTFPVTTRAAVTRPNAFTFTDVTGIALSTLTTSNTITVSGIEAAANVSFVTSGGTVHEYSKNAGAWTAVGATTVNNSDTLAVRMISPAGAGAGNNTVTIGGVSDTYTVTTSVDTTPNAFTFTDITSLGGVLCTSNTITLAGMTAAVPVAATVTGGLMKVNAGGYVASANVQNGDTITLQATASLVPGGKVNVVCTVETISDTYTITTRPISAPDF